MEEASGGGIWSSYLEEASSMRNQGGDIMKEASWEVSRGLAGRAGAPAPSSPLRAGLGLRSPGWIIFSEELFLIEFIILFKILLEF